ncbi:hypothetical protein [Bradyrhizobium sp.]|uniref:hypothetical protein n=1 Tax=Bradyrhizobium sp. TaxID=376 RepID=UPI004038082B
MTLLTGCLTAVAVHAQENLEAGKSPAQIFAGTCNACHKSPRGLLKSVPASSLPSFLRQHYTTSIDMASVLSSYLVANGAADTRYQSKGKDGARDGTKEASRTPAEGAKHRPPRAVETTDPMRPDLIRPEPPAQAAVDKGKKDKGKKGRPEEPARTEPAAEAPKETAKGGEGEKPAGEPKVESAKVEPAKEATGEPAASRPDPVPAVTPAPATSAAAPATSTATAAPGASSVPPVQPLDGPSEPAVERPKSIIELPKPPAVAAAPALPPVPPAGPPMVPISQ